MRIIQVSNVSSPVTSFVQTVADKYYAQWKSQALAQDNHLLIQYGNESSWSLGESMFADMWLQTGLISQDVRFRFVHLLANNDSQLSLQIFTAHVNFLKTVNTAAPQKFNTSEIGIPLDSLRTNNVTYSSNMFVAGFADTELQSIILSGMDGHPLNEDLSIVNNTLSVGSTRSVRLVHSSRHSRLIVFITQPKSRIRVCSSRTKVSLSPPTYRPKNH